jgi:hypothetical protein
MTVEQLTTVSQNGTGYTPPVADPLLNSVQAAVYLNVPVSTLRNYRRAWGLHPSKVGRALQYPQSQLDALLARNRETGEDPGGELRQTG